MALATKALALDETLQRVVSELQRITGASVTANIGDLADVNISTPTNGDILQYNSSSQEWENTTLPSGLHTYNNTEKRVGTWIDGKPLYEKTISVQFQTTNNEIDLSADNIETFMFVPDATFKIQTGSKNVTNYGFYSSNTDRVQAYYRDSDHKVIILSVASNIAGDGYLTYRYTKTTDTV